MLQTQHVLSDANKICADKSDDIGVLFLVMSNSAKEMSNDGTLHHYENVGNVPS